MVRAKSGLPTSVISQKGNHATLDVYVLRYVGAWRSEDWILQSGRDASFSSVFGCRRKSSILQFFYQYNCVLRTLALNLHESGFLQMIPVQREQRPYTLTIIGHASCPAVGH